MATHTLIKEINGKPFIIGHVCQHPDGTFWFNPNLSTRRPSRKKWTNAMQCIPNWALNMADRIE